MLAVLNISNVILIFIFCVAFTMSMINYLIFKKDFFLYLSCMFIIFVADLAIISLTENVPWFKKMYDSSFLTVPTWKTLVYASFFLCLIMAMNRLCRLKHVKALYGLLGALVLYLLFIPVMDDGALKSWLYYEPNQVFLFALGVVLIVHGRRMEKVGERKAGENSLLVKLDKIGMKIAVIGVIFCIFAVAILLEDTYVIFFIDNYDQAIYINNRSFSEDVFRIVMSITVIMYEYEFLSSHMQRYEEEESVTVYDAESEAADGGLGEKRYSKLFIYSKEYQLTTREQEILTLLVAGKKTQEIADSLQISLGTAKTHIHNIFSKVGVSRRSMLIKNYDDYTVEEFTLRKINEMWG